MAAFEVFSIDLAALDRAIGSRDATLVTSVSTRDDPTELTQAFDALVMRGTRPFRGDTYSLSRATLRLCRAIGRRINGNTVDLLSRESLDRAGQISRPLALGVSIDDLVASGVVPIDGLPRDIQFQFGVVQAARIPALHARWQQAQPGDPTDDDADGLLAEMGDWLEVAAARNESLVGIYWP